MVEIYSINGALVKAVKTRTVDVSDLINGMYIIFVQTESGVTQSKFTKQ